ncbi:hypothetical protein [Rhodovibrio salinarum]|uniref:Outer membrane protein beta-barrel domain-containing protein n=1 Tax=Rhodovibrio salinarum TaxID=1087 RepID=A0A934QEZ0_9PROT|nr:hypothetical protein [Rhodovibrio salinarum]MBK1695888.1 hypothetical protein [Rhodovibrio salinarum]
MRIKIAALLVAALALPGTALAQTGDQEPGPKQGDWEITLSGNGTSNNDFDNHQIGISGSVGNYVTDNILLGARQSINFADLEDDDQVNAATRGFIDYVFDLGRFRPYIGASFGGIYGDNVNDSFATGPEAGLKYYADNNTFIFVQSEYQFTFSNAEDADEAADDGQFYHLVGVGFNF